MRNITPELKSYIDTHLKATIESAKRALNRLESHLEATLESAKRALNRVRK